MCIGLFILKEVYNYAYISRLYSVLPFSLDGEMKLQPIFDSPWTDTQLFPEKYNKYFK